MTSLNGVQQRESFCGRSRQECEKPCCGDQSEELAEPSATTILEVSGL